jgi:hypothetical protein
MADDAAMIPLVGPWSRRQARELAIPKRPGGLTSQGFCWMVTPAEHALVEVARMVHRLERNRAYRKRRAALVRELAATADLRQFREQIQREGAALIRGYVREWRRSLR